MRHSYRHIIGLVILLLSISTTSKANVVETNVSADSIAQQQAIEKLFWKPNPAKAVWLGTIFPGGGQIYNRSYWKLPIVYGGLMGCAYAVMYTSDQYLAYKEAYRDIYYDIQNSTVSNDPSKSYIAILPDGYTIQHLGGVSTYQKRLADWQNTTRRYRDLSIAAMVLVYALTVVEAYVDAQLFDFDISPDLTLNVYPQVYYNEMQCQRNVELKLALSF